MTLLFNQLLQVTRKHARLTKKELEAMNQTHAEGQSQTARSNQSESPKETSQGQTARTDQSASPEKKAWQKAPFVVDNYANRHLAQQKILEQQQKQIKEQQKLIEELTYLQKQQMLQQQVLQTQTQQITAASKHGHQGGGDASKLQQHIDNLQKELIIKNHDLDELQKEIEINQVQETERYSKTFAGMPHKEFFLFIRISSLIMLDEDFMAKIMGLSFCHFPF